MSKNSEATFSRTRLLGIDLVTLTSHDSINAAVQSGHISNVTAGGTQLEDLPWLVRWYFPLTRFFSSGFRVWFLPFRTMDNPTYAPCRAFLDAKFSLKRDISAGIMRTANLLTGEAPDGTPGKDPTDRQLSDVAIQTLWSYMVPQDGHPPIPDSVLNDATKQLLGIVDSFLPWKFLPAPRALSRVYNYADETLRATKEREALPDQAVIDLAQVFFATNANMPTLLRAVHARPDEELHAIIASIGVVENSIRMCVQNGDLGGVLPHDDGAVAGKTLVLLNIRTAAQQTGGLEYCFATGPGQRRCPAEKVVLNYIEGVKDELRKRRDSSKKD